MTTREAKRITRRRETTPTVAMLKRFLAGPHSRDGRELMAALTFDPTFRPRFAWLEEQFRTLEQQDLAPPPLIGGDDLVQELARDSDVLGFTPAPGSEDRRHALRVEISRPGVELRRIIPWRMRNTTTNATNVMPIRQ